ncbi:hypothetical protein WN944_028452 [Citrus x changshan-huyou]|uniref:Uncharacterized protein n=2 Tax=Citrus TaxID=2706 RepID=V4U932_CITCL|nr:hypothetical protein CICLE_v10030089mg [Citrus x clementina]KAH9655056.1 hypothetical protein KPL70_022193 [Citrus sinensis]
MEYLKVSGSKASPKRELRASKNRQQQKTVTSNVMEAIAQVSNGGGGVHVSEANDNGVVRMKIMVRKQDLKQILQVMNMNGANNSHSRSEAANAPLSAPSAEQWLNLLRRKHNIVKAVNSGKENQRRSWRPELQSIPEEL